MHHKNYETNPRSAPRKQEYVFYNVSFRATKQNKSPAETNPSSNQFGVSPATASIGDVFSTNDARIRIWMRNGQSLFLKKADVLDHSPLRLIKAVLN